MKGFKELFTVASSIPKGSDREALTLYIAWELSRLESGPPKLTAAEAAELEKAEQAWEKSKLLQSEVVDPASVVDSATLDEIEKPADLQKALPVRRKVPHQARKSA
jgi:hypothetical protein